MKQARKVHDASLLWYHIPSISVHSLMRAEIVSRCGAHNEGYSIADHEGSQNHLYSDSVYL